VSGRSEISSLPISLQESNIPTKLSLSFRIKLRLIMSSIPSHLFLTPQRRPVSDQSPYRATLSKPKSNARYSISYVGRNDSSRSDELKRKAFLITGLLPVCGALLSSLNGMLMVLDKQNYHISTVDYFRERTAQAMLSFGRQLLTLISLVASVAFKIISPPLAIILTGSSLLLDMALLSLHQSVDSKESLERRRLGEEG
jgi:hypothetical protein